MRDGVVEVRPGMLRCTALVRSIIILAVLLAALPLYAQVAIVRPIGPPTTNDVIIAQIEFIQNGDCRITPTTVVNGNLIRTVVAVSNCTPLLPFLASVSTGFGPLPAGTYTYEAYVSYFGGPPFFVGRTTIVVRDPPVPVPTLDTTWLLLLAITLGALAIMTLRRVS